MRIVVVICVLSLNAFILGYALRCLIDMHQECEMMRESETTLIEVVVYHHKKLKEIEKRITQLEVQQETILTLARILIKKPEVLISFREDKFPAFAGTLSVTVPILGDHPHEETSNEDQNDLDNVTRVIRLL